MKSRILNSVSAQNGCAWFHGNSGQHVRKRSKITFTNQKKNTIQMQSFARIWKIKSRQKFSYHNERIYTAIFTIEGKKKRGFWRKLKGPQKRVKITNLKKG